MDLYQHLRDSLFAYYVKWQRRIVPGLKDSQYLYVDKLLTVVNAESYWLDLGCGHRIVPAWTGFDETILSGRAGFLVGVDRDLESLLRHQNLDAKVIADIDALPFRPGTFNLVTANMVVEHLQEPSANLREIARVLQPGGAFIFHTVNILHYNAFISWLLPQSIKVRLVNFLENRHAKDIYPTHYHLNTQRSISKVAPDAGFETPEVEMVNSSAETIMLGPIVIVELLLIRILNLKKCIRWRSNIIATLRSRRSGSQEITTGIGTSQEQTAMASR